MSEKPRFSTQSPTAKQHQTDTEQFFKHRNDAIKNALKGMIPELEGSRLRIEFYCECYNINCLQRIGLLLAEYERIHSHPRHFLVKPQHVAEGETIIVRHHHYWVIEKLA